MYSGNPGLCMHRFQPEQRRPESEPEQRFSSSGIYQKDLCIKRSLAVIFRLASVRSVFARPRGVLYPILLQLILLYPLLLPPAFCQLLLTLSESLPAAASAGTPFLAPGWYGFCLVSFFPHAPLPFYVFQQSPHLALPIYSNPVFLQTCGADTVPFCKGAGKCAVIDLPASAGRASLL